MMNRTAWTLLLILGSASAASAQTLSGNPVADAAHALGRSGFKDGAPPESSPTRFKSDGTRRVVAACARQIGDDDAQHKAMEEVYLKLLENYEKSVVQAGAASDAAGALAFSIAVLYAGAKEAELDDQAYLALIGRLQASLDVPAVRNASDAQKQEAYEWSLCAAGTVLALAQLAVTPEAKAGVRKLAKVQLDNLLGADLDRLTLNGKEVRLKGNAPGGPVEGFTFTPPEGWTTDKVWHVCRKGGTNPNDRSTSTAFIRFPPAIDAGPDIGAALRELWKQVVPAELAGRHTSMVYRRLVGDGLPAQFIFGAGLEKDHKADSLFTLYLLDLGARWQPVVVAQTYDDPDGSVGNSMRMMASLSYGGTAALAEGFLATFRCPAAKGRALVSKEALVGSYGYGNSSSLQWENIYTGAASMTVVSYGGTLDLREDGTFDYSFQGASGVVGALRVATDKDQGTWSVKDDLLVLASKTGSDRKYRVAGLTLFEDGVKVAVLLLRLNVAVNAVTGGDRSDWFSTKKK